MLGKGRSKWAVFKNLTLIPGVLFICLSYGMDGSTLVLPVGCFGEQKWCTGESTRLPPYYTYVGWVCCWFSLLLQEVFLRILQFSSLLKNKHFQIPVRCGMHRHAIIIILNKILRTPKCDQKVKLQRFW